MHSNPHGLSSKEAHKRRLIYGGNHIQHSRFLETFRLLIYQFTNPLSLILIGAAVLAFFLADKLDATIILAIVFISGLIGFWQERGATQAVEKLLKMVEAKTIVIREDKRISVSAKEIVPGDILYLSAGDVISGDCLILELKDLFVDESLLTGETAPVEKKLGSLPKETPLTKRFNSLFAGTHVISGTALAIVINTGKSTEIGQLSEHLEGKKRTSEFEFDIRRFGTFLVEVTFVLVILLFLFNALLHKPILESFLFALALAVGLTPQLLPAIIAVNLAHGAKKMAAHHVIVKRLAAIENAGSMTILCVDKTGTLTEGKVQLLEGVNAEGKKNEKTEKYGVLNAYFQSGYANSIDMALVKHLPKDLSDYKKIDELPYDFQRKRLSVLLEDKEGPLLISKGAVNSILPLCKTIEKDNTQSSISEYANKLEEFYLSQGEKGIRVLAVAYKRVKEKILTASNESDLTFIGFLLLTDPPKKTIKNTLRQIVEAGISIKMISGDNQRIAHYIAEQVGIENPVVMTGEELSRHHDRQLYRKIDKIDVFAEIDPYQKERIIRLLKQQKHIVGFLGDGINDSLAIHAADVGISVNSAAGILKEEADIVMLRKDLSVLLKGIEEGRKTYGNTLKYIFMATSANFGNMFSMAIASLFLPFIPLLPKQILLTNLLTDFPEMTISTDRVDSEVLSQPLRLNIRFITYFMIVFGLLSSIFDFMTFGALLWMGASAEQFRTAWFTESIISASTIVLFIRTQKPFYSSRPSFYLMGAVFATCIITLILPWTPLGKLFNLIVLSPKYYVAIFGIIALYALSVEVTKFFFYRWIKTSKNLGKRNFQRLSRLNGR